MDHGRLRGQRRSTAGLRGRAWWRDPPNPRARSDVRPSRYDGGRPEGRWRRATLPITRRGASPFRAAGHWRRNPRQPASLSDVEAHRAADSQEPAPGKRPNLSLFLRLQTARSPDAQQKLPAFPRGAPTTIGHHSNSRKTLSDRTISQSPGLRQTWQGDWGHAIRSQPRSWERESAHH